MTNTQPETPAPTAAPKAFDYDAWIADAKKPHSALAEELLQLKIRLFAYLESQGIVLVTAEFDGCSDSGQIESITAFDAHGEVGLPEQGFAILRGDAAAGTESNEASGEPLRETIETLVYDLLEAEHYGWENDGGAFGEFRFDVATQQITLGCNIRIASADYYETCL